MCVCREHWKHPVAHALNRGPARFVGGAPRRQAAAEAEQVQARMDAEKEEKLRLKAEQAGETYTPSSPTKRQPYALLLVTSAGSATAPRQTAH